MDKDNLYLSKVNKLRIVKVFDLLIRFVLTIGGTVFLMLLFMFLNNKFNISYFICFLMSIVLPNIYSVLINMSLGKLDNRIKEIESEVLSLEKEFSECRDLNKNDIIKNIEIRFDGLSKDKKIKLLNYIKNKIGNEDVYKYINKLEEDEVLTLFENLNDVYSKKRSIK